MKDLVIQIEDLSCPTCAQKIGTTLSKLNGVAEAKVHFATGKAKVKYDPEVVGEEEITSRRLRK